MWRNGVSGLRTKWFVLEPLDPKHNEADHRAWTSSIDHIRATPGFHAELWGGDDWPYPMSLEDNLRDLTKHGEEFRQGEAFAYSVIDPRDGDVIGCVYVDPDEVADLDSVLEQAVREWLSGEDWNFTSVRFPGRD